MAYDKNIPVDPEENLKRLQGIGCHLAAKLVRKEELRDSKQAAIRLMEETIANLDADPQTQQEIEDASRREQILVGYRYDLQGLDSEIREIKGKLAWNERKQDNVSNTAAMKSELRHQPFKTLKVEG